MKEVFTLHFSVNGVPKKVINHSLVRLHGIKKIRLTKENAPVFITST